MSRSRRLLPALVWMVACVLFAAPSERAELSADQRKAYATLRKDFVLAMALPAAPKGEKPRRQHRRFLSALNRFLESVGDASPLHTAAAHYFRGRMAVKLRRPDRAGRDLRAAVEHMENTARTADDRPGGLPSICAVRIFLAFTALEEGQERIMAELEAIPADSPKPEFHEVGELLNKWADALADHDRDDLALRAYRFIQHFGLWEEEAQNPERRIHLLRLRKQGGIPAGRD